MGGDRKTIIIGGGVAGLAAACHLAEHHHPVTLVEAGTYPIHKVCGEFFSPEALPILERWDLAPKIRLRTARFVIGKHSFTLSLPSPAGSLSRYTFDAKLAAKARELGAEVLTGVRCKKLERCDAHWEVKLENGTLQADHLMVGTGRLTGQKRPNFPYRGYKAHFEGKSDSLEMHLHPGAYLGISPVADGVLNVACLAKEGGPGIEDLLPPALKDYQIFDWLEVSAPEFGIKRVPQWEDALFVGDAAGTIAPICGDGLAMGLTSGVMAAEHILKGEVGAFRKAWLKRYGKRLKLGKVLHKMVLQAPNVARLAKGCPPLLSWIFQQTREI